MTTQPPKTPSAPPSPGPRPAPPPTRHTNLRGWLIIVSILGIIFAGAAAAYLLRPLDAPVPDGAGALYAGLAQGATTQGFPRLGSPDAPVLIEDFSSFACPHCREFHEGQFVALLDAINAGEVQFVFIPIAHIGWGAREAARAMLCAGEQGQSWTMMDVLFDWQRRFLTSTFDSRRIRKGAQEMGLDMGDFDTCMRGSAAGEVLDRARLEFDRRGLTGTPSFFINGQKVQDYREFEVFSVGYDSAEVPAS